MRKTLVCVSTAALALAGTPLLTAPAAAATRPFISELHYDNVSTDVGEAVEITADPGADLTGWAVVPYNGNGGAAYSAVTLAQVVGASGAVVVPISGLQNGDPDGIALVRPDGSVAEFLSYGGVFAATSGPAVGRSSTDVGVEESGSTPVGYSLQRTATGAFAAPAPNTFGTPNGAPGPELEPEPEPEPEYDPLTCGAPAAPISQVQGEGTASPVVGQTVTVEAVVTAVKPGLRGYYLQEEAADVDDLATTSEGIFVFTGGTPTTQVGQTLRVTGQVSEFGGNGAVTQLGGTTSVQCEVDAVATTPSNVQFPLAAPGDMERYEGMLVTFEQDLVISEYFNYDQFGEVVVAVPPDGARLWTPTAVVEPGPAAVALAAEYAKRQITIDDSSTRSNPDVLLHPGNGEPFSATNRFRGGDTVTGITGVIDHSFGRYRVHPTQYGEHTVLNPRPQSAPAVGGDIQVASFNVLNYFLTLDRGGSTEDCGPVDNRQECRGADADQPQELERQRAKILAALEGLDADVVGLMEMENTPGVEPAADLVAGLNASMGAGTYDYVDTGVIGTDAIRLGMLYKPDEVRPVGDFAVLDSSVDPRFVDTANRPMLTQTFERVYDGARFTVSVNHLKSKGSACAGDPDLGDGAGNCNRTRTDAAAAIVDFLASDPTGSGDPDHLVIGDLNSYDHEDPIDALVAGGFTDQIKVTGGEYAYGYVFDGQAGYLDHALANATLTSQVTGAAEWHINADEPDVLDYDTSFKGPGQEALYEPDPFRSSDHDAVLVGLDLVAPATPTTCLGEAVTVAGTSGDDVLTGTQGRDVIHAGGGDDVVHALNGDDVVCGGFGADRVVGGNGADRLDGALGVDTLEGGNGGDVLTGGEHDDVLTGGNGDDVLRGEGGDDELDGGRGDDIEIH